MKQYERIAGTVDYTGREASLLLRISDTCHSIFSRYGYERAVLPVLERSDIFLQRSGEEIRSRMYMLQDPSGREICLRPEMTISAARAFLGDASAQRLPARLSYLGEVFRYDKVREGRYRQFLQAGVENIGGKNRLAADTEAVALALEVVREVGVTDFRLVVGDLELASEFINSLPISASVRTKLLENFWRRDAFNLLLERFSKAAADSDVSNVSNDTGDAATHELAEVFSSLGERASRTLVRQIFSLFVEKEIGYRDLDEIAERFLQRFTADKALRLPQDCYEALQEYLSISGEPETVFEKLGELLKRIDAKPGQTLVSLRRRMELLAAQNVLPGDTTLDLGFRRGIEYYTGLVFEIHCDAIGRQVSQICGGGRYDKLLSTLGAPNPIPAVGFALGVDRLLLALEKFAAPPRPAAPVDALLVTAGEVRDETTWEIARLCREAGWRVRVEFDRRRLSDSLGHASEEEIPYVVIAGEDELGAGGVRIRDMKRRSEELVKVDALKDFVRSRVEAGKS